MISGRQIALVIHSGSGPAIANVSTALHLARLKHQLLDLNGCGIWPRLDQFSCLLLVIDSQDQFSEEQQQSISTYVESGGALVVILRSWSNSVAHLVGARDRGCARDEDVYRAVDIFFCTDVLPGLEGISIPEEAYINPLELTSDSKVAIESSDGAPIAWFRRVGRGRIFVWNCSFIERKIWQGPIVASIIETQPITVRPIVNAGLIQIDDFPCAAAPIKFPPIAEEYDLTLLSFYDRIWLPDMLQLAEQHNIAYTFLTVFNYNALIEPPFNFDEWSTKRDEDEPDAEPFAVYAARLIGQSHELGLHGYNHCPLCMDVWGSKKNMIRAMHAARARWQNDALGPLPRTYVPPMNTYDAAGLEAVTQIFPSIGVVAGYLEGEYSKGRDRNLGVDPWDSDILFVPRVTSGYRLTPLLKFRMIAQLGLFGAWAHFLHPDDIIDIPERRPDAPRTRNNDRLPWRRNGASHRDGMYDQFSDWLNELGKTYPWLRYRRTEDAEPVFRSHLTNDVDVFIESERVRISTSASTYLQVNLVDDRKIDAQTLRGAKLVDEAHYNEKTIYTIYSDENTISFNLLPI